MCDVCKPFPGTAQAVLGAIIALQGDRAYADASYEGLSRHIRAAYGLERSTEAVTYAVRILAQAGAITRERRKGYPSRYRVVRQAVAPVEPQATFAEPDLERVLAYRRKLLGKRAMIGREIHRCDAWLMRGDADLAGPSLDEQGRARPYKVNKP